MTHLLVQWGLAAGKLSFGPVSENLAQRYTIPDPNPVWGGWSWIISIIVIIAAVVAWLILVRRQQKRIHRTFQLEITNQGNTRSRYELQAETPGSDLEFIFTMNGVKLQGPEVTYTTRVETAPAPQPTRTQPAATQPPASPGGANLDGAKQAKDRTMGAGNALTDLLGRVGMILPRSVGTPLLQASSRIRRGQGTVRRVEQLPGRAARLKPKGMPKKPPTTSAGAEWQAPAHPATEPASPSTVTYTTVEESLIKTPFVEPGETVTIDLLVKPTDLYQTQDYKFVVQSRSIEQPEAPFVTEEGGFHIQGLTLLERFGPFLIVLLVAALIIVAAFSLIAAAS